MDPFEAYHGRTARQHQEAFDRLAPHGWRLISLNVYGNPGSARYNAVWVKRPGRDHLAFHGVADADYQGRFDAAVAAGFAPVLVTATGAGSAAVFAAVFERGVPGPWMARHGLTPLAFELVDAVARSGGMVLRSLAVYGSAADPRCTAVWHPRPDGLVSHLRLQTAEADHQAVFDAESSLPFFRPRAIAVAADRRITAVFSNDHVGRWSACHGLTAAQYQQAFDQAVAAGLMPISVSAGGAGAAARFAAIFAERDVAPARQWWATGTRPAVLAGSEAIVERFMKRHGIRAAQLTVLRRGKVFLERAYTWSEPGTRRTGVRDRMLLASCSKVFVTAAAQWCYDQRIGRTRRRLLRSTTAVYPRLGFANPADPRSDTITMQQLLDHRAGYTNVPSDPTYDMRGIARDLGLARPPTPEEIARRIYATRNLGTNPGTTYSYNNFGYLVAALVVERVSGLPYIDLVRRRLLQPLGITDVAPCPTNGPAGWPANHVVPEDDGIGAVALRPQDNDLVPAVFSGDQMVKASALGSCGIASSATALARFIHVHAVWGTGPRMAGRRYGSTPGAQSAAVSRADGGDWTLIFNSRMGFSNDDWNRLIDELDDALDGLL